MKLTPSHIDAIIMNVRSAEGDLIGCFQGSSPPDANLCGAIGRLESALQMAKECYAEAKVMYLEQISHRPSRLLNPCQASKEHVAGWMQNYGRRDKDPQKIINNFDILIKEYGIKYVFVESGRFAIEQKFEDLDVNPNDYPTAMFWCELSWGSGGDDGYDFAYYSWGDTLGEAINSCLNDFKLAVLAGEDDQVKIAKETGIYSKLIGEESLEHSPDSEKIAAIRSWYKTLNK